MELYVDYPYYTEEYKGSLLQEEFDRSVVKASAHVRRITFGRADDYSDFAEVKLAVCAVCDVLAADVKRRDKHHGMNVISENNDGYSVSYVQEQTAGETTEEILSRKIYKAAEIFLEPTGLLNWGLNDDLECRYYNL